MHGIHTLFMKILIDAWEMIPVSPKAVRHTTNENIKKIPNTNIARAIDFSIKICTPYIVIPNITKNAVANAVMPIIPNSCPKAVKTLPYPKSPLGILPVLSISLISAAPDTHLSESNIPNS